MSDIRPVGIIDSGLGGLTVAREIQRLLPLEQLIYLGDTARYPYGNRADAIILEYSLQAAKALLSMDIKMLVVACNTMSAVALDTITKYVKEIPVIGVVMPGVRAAILRTADQKIGVIGTEATIRSGAYRQAIARIDKGVAVYEMASPLLVPLVEQALLNHDITRLTAQYYLDEMVDLGVDCLILGCTHYSLLLEVIQGTVGTHMQLLDSALWTAKEVQDILHAVGAQADGNGPGCGKSQFFFTEQPDHASVLINLFFGGQLPNSNTHVLDMHGGR